MNELEIKHEVLKSILEELDEVVIAFSGGVDSTLLAKVAYDVLGEKAEAITILSPLFSKEELAEAKFLAETIGIKHYILDKGEDSPSWFADNPSDRCYICKTETLDLILDYCKESNIRGQLIEGSNFDDLDDYRPGYKAVSEHSVKSPLMDAELTKEEVRELSKVLDLPCWDKPSSPCLATRFFFGEEITKEKLSQVYEAERYLKTLEIPVVRVRSHQGVARIETLKEYFDVVMEFSTEIEEKFRKLGFEFITLDLRGYKQGSMNIAKDD
ncbi:MAG: ATP-dependent sacrificial sulfur transferase LarE [Asgard group archaeon]|nr:ATP-dependent sacrificial sulfur transferase LarE [Asgard group archaeon]